MIRLDVSTMSEDGRKSLLVVDRRSFAGACVADFFKRALPNLPVRHLALLSQVNEIHENEIQLAFVSLSSYNSSGSLINDIIELNLHERGIPIALFGEPDDEDTRSKLILLGIKGFVSEYCSQDVVSAATLLMIAGEKYFPSGHHPDSKLRIHPQIGTGPGFELFDRLPANGNDDRLAAHASFTKKEIDVLAGIAQGQPNKTIATRLGIAENTVKIHVRGILRKLGASNRTEAVVIAQKRRMIY
jgi:DNA-binding NarL/FixJ family response regulator